MRQPRGAAERRRLHVRRHDPTPGLADGGLEIGEAFGKRPGDCRCLVGHRSVRLDEDEPYVGAPEAPKVGVERRARTERRRHRARTERCQHEASLSNVGRRHRIGKGDSGRESAPELLARKQHDDGPCQRAEREPRASARHGRRHLAGREACQYVRQAHCQHGGCGNARDQPPRHGACKHGGDVAQMSRVPEQIELPPVEPGRSHVEIVARDEHDPDRRQNAARQPPRPPVRDRQEQDAQSKLERQRASPPDLQRRPDILKRQGGVEEDERDAQRGPGAPTGEELPCHALHR